jgi:hypothetical protein
LLHIQICASTRPMPSYTKSTETEVQVSLDTTSTSTSFSTLRPKQDKNTTCKKLKLASRILLEEYQNYCNKAYGYSDHNWLRITHLDYHYSRNETRLPVIGSLYSQFRVSFSYIEKDNSYQKHFTKQEVPKKSFFNNKYNSEAPINRFCVLSKYVKGGFSRDRLIRQNLDTEGETYSL